MSTKDDSFIGGYIAGIFMGTVVAIIVFIFL